MIQSKSVCTCGSERRSWHVSALASFTLVLALIESSSFAQVMSALLVSRMQINLRRPIDSNFTKSNGPQLTPLRFQMGQVESNLAPSVRGRLAVAFTPFFSVGNLGDEVS